LILSKGVIYKAKESELQEFIDLHLSKRDFVHYESTFYLTKKGIDKLEDYIEYENRLKVYLPYFANRIKLDLSFSDHNGTQTETYNEITINVIDMKSNHPLKKEHFLLFLEAINNDCAQDIEDQ
ncbi:MAG: hypothetical protein WCI62_02450, partial [Erysipelotrichaceae bacterium]